MSVRKIFLLSIILFLYQRNNVEASLKEFIKFKQVEYEKLPISGNFPFDQYNNIPQGFAPYISNESSKVFIAVPRRYLGVPSTLNYVSIEHGQSLLLNPKLHSYPNYEMNELDPLNRPSIDRIVSVYRPRVDECERLWFVDSGIINTSGASTIVQRPSIWVIDLKTDRVVNRYEIPATVSKNGAGFASITIDVIDCENDTFAYLPDLLSSQILVYSLKANKSYHIEHNYFRMHPLQGDYNVDGLRFSWEDAIFSIALSKRDADSYRLAYFHPMSSFYEFAVSTRILRNETLATRSYHDDDFKLIGSRGKNTQSTMHGVHQKTGAMFFAEINKNAVSCWNSRSALRPSNMVEVAQDNVTLIYPSDLSVVNDDLWVMSNRMPRHLYSKLDVDDYNFRIFRTTVSDAIKGTKCEAREGSKRRSTKTPSTLSSRRALIRNII